MAEKNVTVIYTAPPIWAKMTAWVLMGIGGFVLLPIAAIGGERWLLVFAAPLLLVGLVLFSTRLHIGLERSAGIVRVTNSLFGLQLRERRYPRSEVAGLDLHRVAGTERERASDTWYLRLRLRDRTYTIGKFDSRLSALLARRDVDEALQSLPPTPVEEVSPEEERNRTRREAASDYYRQGLALFSAGDKEGAQAEFRKALAFAQEPLLRRMIEQRLAELEMR